MDRDSVSSEVRLVLLMLYRFEGVYWRYGKPVLRVRRDSCDSVPVFMLYVVMYKLDVLIVSLSLFLQGDH